MTNLSKVKAEIERRLKGYDPDYTSAGKELEELLSLIGSLEEDKAGSDDEMPDFSTLGGVLRRLQWLENDSLFGSNEGMDVCVHFGSMHRPCRIVGIYLDSSSSKEQIRIDLFPKK